MAFNGSGVFNRLRNWVADKNASINIDSTRMDGEDDGFATGLSNCICKDGQTTITADIPWANHKLTGLATGTGIADAASLANVKAATGTWVIGTGTADAITATYVPPYQALVDGMLCFVRAPGANTLTNPTFAPDGFTAHTITKLGGAALVANEWIALQELELRYNLANTRWELLNPTNVGVFAQLAAANTFVAASQTIQSTDASAAQGPTLNIDRFSASPAASDSLGVIPFTGRNSAAATKTYAELMAILLDPVAGTEDGKLQFYTMIAGTLTLFAEFSQGLTMNGAAGDPGSGNINAVRYFQSNLQTEQRAQTVFTETGAVATGTTTVPADDTIPQITEGDEYMTRTITPKSATSTLEIEIVAFLTNSASSSGIGALFQDATANALAAGFHVVSTGASAPFVLRHKMAAGTTSAITFRFRFGCAGAGTTTFNGTAGGRLFGGVMASSIKITEILP